MNRRGSPLSTFGRDEASYVQSRQELRPGDQLFLYTDGVVEEPAADGTLFGLERLLHTINHTERNTEQSLEAVSRAIATHTDDRFDHDDVTFMALEICQP